jgi:hypothetical protein
MVQLVHSTAIGTPYNLMETLPGNFEICEFYSQCSIASFYDTSGNPGARFNKARDIIFKMRNGDPDRFNQYIHYLRDEFTEIAKSMNGSKK